MQCKQQQTGSTNAHLALVLKAINSLQSRTIRNLPAFVMVVIPDEPIQRAFGYPDYQLVFEDNVSVLIKVTSSDTSARDYFLDYTPGLTPIIGLTIRSKDTIWTVANRLLQILETLGCQMNRLNKTERNGKSRLLIDSFPRHVKVPYMHKPFFPENRQLTRV